MNARSKLLLTVCALLLFAGCQGGMPPRRSLAANEPILDVPGESDSRLASAAPASPGNSVVDRHPLFSKPRQYYESSGDNKVVKTASATFIGIPAGVVGEIKQIFVGQPTAAR